MSGVGPVSVDRARNRFHVTRTFLPQRRLTEVDQWQSVEDLVWAQLESRERARVHAMSKSEAKIVHACVLH